MKRTLFALIPLCVLLNGCSTISEQKQTHVSSSFIHQHSVIKTSKEKYPAKNPQNVAVYNHKESPHAPYRIIGMAKVSNRNVLGMKRHEETVQTMMRQLAASVGGDGLIDMNKTNDGLEANIIAFQKILI